jgi:pimeloyl-ACP methyl ester carboxylesterase
MHIDDLSAPDTRMYTLYNKEIENTPIICIGSFEGGMPLCWGKKMADVISFHPICIVRYFGIDEREKYLEYFDITSFVILIKWLLIQYKTSNVILIGNGRGAELALLLGIYFPQLCKKIIAVVPSSIVYGGFPYVNRPAWMIGDTIVNFMKGNDAMNSDWTIKEDIVLNMSHGRIPFHKNTEDDPLCLADNYLFERVSLQNKTIDSVLSVENIQVPLLIFSGTKDSMWPSYMYAQEIMYNLDMHESKIYREHVVYENVGHGIIWNFDLPFWHPIGQIWCSFGGNVKENKKANEDCWQRIMHFIKW